MIVRKITEVRATFRAYCDFVVDNNEVLVIGRLKKKDVVMISVDMWTKLQEAKEKLEQLEMSAVGKNKKP